MKQFFPSTIQFRKLPDVKESTGDSRTTHYRKIQDGLMTRPVSRGGGRVAWPGYEIDAINRARVSGFRDEAIKDLVTKLHELREALKPGLDIPIQLASIFDELNNNSKKNKTV